MSWLSDFYPYTTGDKKQSGYHCFAFLLQIYHQKVFDTQIKTENNTPQTERPSFSFLTFLPHYKLLFIFSHALYFNNILSLPPATLYPLHMQLNIFLSRNNSHTHTDTETHTHAHMHTSKQANSFFPYSTSFLPCAHECENQDFQLDLLCLCTWLCLPGDEHQKCKLRNLTTWAGVPMRVTS